MYKPSIFSRPKKLSNKKCLFCKKQFEGQPNSKYCSLECKEADKKVKDFISSL